MDGKILRTVLGRNIKNFRKKRNWSQADLAEKAGISITFLSDIERGNKWPYPETLTSMAEALETGVHELFLEQEGSGDFPCRDRDAMGQLMDDLSGFLYKSMNLAVKQSMERLKKQYLGAETGPL